MKDGIHPKYQEVVFQDSSTGTQFLMRSTIRTEKKVQYE
ncbi:MAG: 50S ribosomal protein L31, partial [Planctomycetaceae bacterium]|nr:50S ribosomal protein L31 [Planctomycetaceae bacterium]